MDDPSTLPGNATATWDATHQRSTVELWKSLFVVHFTVLTVYCHLSSIRKEPILRWKLLFYFLVPFSIFVNYALALLVLAITALVYTIKRRPDRWQRLSRIASWYFGILPREGEESEPKPQRIEKLVGRLVVLSALIVQSIGTIYIHSRRQEDQITHIDRRIFQLACTNLLCLIHTILILVKTPLLSKPVPATLPSETETEGGVEVFMIFLRETLRETLDLPTELWRRLVSHAAYIVVQGALANLVALLAGRTFGGYTLVGLMTPVWTVGGTVHWALTPLVVWALSTGLIKSYQYRSKKSARSEFEEEFLTGPIATVAVEIGWPLLLVFWLGWAFDVAGFAMDVRDMITQTHLLNSLPSDAVSPLLWSDPVVAKVWTLG